jgi:hypothetical protein
MRKFLIPLLMASALMPAAAVARDRDSLAGAFRERGERSSSDDGSRSERSERPARAERSERPVRAERTDNSARVERGDRVRTREQRNVAVSRPQQIQQVQVQQVQQVQQPVQQRRLRSTNNRFIDGVRSMGTDQQIEGRRTESRRDDRRDGDRRWDGHRRDGDRRWSSDWRRDHRYDWRSYRTRYSSLYRLGSYYDPYGYGYRRFSIGFNLWPNYYRSSYWLNDPWQYRLPPAYGPYRWVRYYDDAILVNIYSGEVVDVIRNFFW